ncbi:MAG: hypothetical protein ACQESR_09210 [Planctomycetota bacterium]
MSKVNSFFLGILVGAITLYGAMTFHVVHAEDGIHVVPKVSNGLRDTYVDIRDFRAAQWHQHKHVALALINAGKDELLKDSAMSNLRRTARDALQSLGLK